MSLELVFTSALRGLKKGSQGYCTVAMSEGMPLSLVPVLESLSGYRHLYSSTMPTSRQNPVILSHVVFFVGGTGRHLFSRIVDAGLDYSGRTNKLAHHLLLENNELVSVDPVMLLKNSDELYYRQWQGEPKTLSSSKELPSEQVSSQVCTYWQDVMGDAAWGGLLAATIETMQSAVVLYRADQDISRLFQESLALLPLSDRWKVTFSTFWMKYPPGVQCQWKAVLAGSPEETLVRERSNRGLLLDLTEPGTSLLDACDTLEDPERGRLWLEWARLGKKVETNEVSYGSVTKRVPFSSDEERRCWKNRDQAAEAFSEPVAFTNNEYEKEKISQLDQIYRELGERKRTGPGRLIIVLLVFFCILLFSILVWGLAKSFPIQNEKESSNERASREALVLSYRTETNPLERQFHEAVFFTKDEKRCPNVERSVI